MLLTRLRLEHSALCCCDKFVVVRVVLGPSWSSVIKHTVYDKKPDGDALRFHQHTQSGFPPWQRGVVLKQHFASLCSAHILPLLERAWIASERASSETVQCFWQQAVACVRDFLGPSEAPSRGAGRGERSESDGALWGEWWTEMRETSACRVSEQLEYKQLVQTVVSPRPGLAATRISLIVLGLPVFDPKRV